MGDEGGWGWRRVGVEEGGGSSAHGQPMGAPSGAPCVALNGLLAHIHIQILNIRIHAMFLAKDSRKITVSAYKIVTSLSHILHSRKVQMTGSSSVGIEGASDVADSPMVWSSLVL
jgi:hypothetical protein